MKKILTLFTLLFCAINSYGQYEYTFDWTWGEVDGNVLASNAEVIVKLTNGDEYTLISDRPPKTGRQILIYNYEIESYTLNTLWLENGFSRSCNNSETLSFNNALCSNGSSLGCYELDPFGNEGESLMALFVSFKRINIPPPPAQSPECYEDDILVDVNSECGNLLVDQWFYTLPGGVETYLAGYDGVNPISINLNDLTATPQNYTNQPIQLRATYQYYTDPEIRIIEFANCSPN